MAYIMSVCPRQIGVAVARFTRRSRVTPRQGALAYVVVASVSLPNHTRQTTDPCNTIHTQRNGTIITVCVIRLIIGESMAAFNSSSASS